MWIELGDSTIVDVDEFAFFQARYYEEETIIYGVTKAGAFSPAIYSTGDKEEALLHFEKLKKACKEKARRTQELFYGNIVENK